MPRVLVVDDERDVVTLIKFLLEKEGHTVLEAFDGGQALKALGIEPEVRLPKSELPDLIILDVMMPVVDGYTVSQRIGANPRTAAIPLVVLTAKGQMKDLFAMSRNVAAYLEKPFDPQKLRDMVGGILKGD